MDLKKIKHNIPRISLKLDKWNTKMSYKTLIHRNWWNYSFTAEYKIDHNLLIKNCCNPGTHITELLKTHDFYFTCGSHKKNLE